MAESLEPSDDDERGPFTFMLPPRSFEGLRAPHSLESTINDGADEVDAWAEAFCNVVEELHNSILESQEEEAIEQQQQQRQQRQQWQQEEEEEVLPPPRIPHPIYDAPDWIKEA